MEESKYYQPDIKEFRVGFEYEYLEHFGKEFGKWNKYKVNWEDSLYHLTNLITTGSVRVKLLDSEDIESFGFKRVGIEELLFEKDNDEYSHYEIDFRPDENETVITYYYQSKLVVAVLPREDRSWSTIFQGKIKNKSELEVLLNQLGIL